MEFNWTVKGQNMSLAVGTKCVPSYACSFMNELESNFIASQQNKPLYGLDKLMISFLSGHKGKRN